MTHPPRLPRFKRAVAADAMQLTARDRAIIRLVYRHRFLRSSHILSLIPGNSQQLLKRLKLLYHHGYLERPRSQLEHYYEGGSREIVYALGNRGAALLKHELGRSFDEIPWGEKNRVIGSMFLKHALLVADIMVALELACRESGVRLLTEVELASLGASGKPRPFQWKVTLASGLKLSVVPDRVFALEFEDDRGESKRAVFFLEADRGTMPVERKNFYQTSFFRKLVAYVATWSQSIHQTLFGFHRFRVLTVTTTDARVKSLLDACAKLKRGQGLFLFTNRDILERPENLLSSRLQTGRRDETANLVELRDAQNSKNTMN